MADVLFVGLQLRREAQGGKGNNEGVEHHCRRAELIKTKQKTTKKNLWLSDALQVRLRPECRDPV